MFTVLITPQHWMNIVTGTGIVTTTTTTTMTTVTVMTTMTIVPSMITPMTGDMVILMLRFPLQHLELRTTILMAIVIICVVYSFMSWL
jgi:hypothetical protein